MFNLKLFLPNCLAITLATLSFATIGYAQDQTAPDETAPANTPETASVDEVVVTGVVGKAVSKLDASISVSALPADDIEKLSPRSMGEVFRSLPGIRSESSGGGGNANITIRGIPLATGGSKYMQIHEDGLPVLEYGDINFANTDNFVRFDSTVDRVESVRGGSASTLASNSPGGIINILSKVGKDESGSFGLSTGVDYDEFRTDFEYGGQLTDSIYYHLGGFYRNGEGVRETGFNGDDGGQIKFNLTKELENGFFRIYVKNLDDKMTTYLPAPVLVKSNGSYGPVNGFDASNQALQTSASANISTFDAYGNPHSRSVTDGIVSKVNAFGFEFDKQIAKDVTINNKFRKSNISGGFISPFTDGFAGGTDTIAKKGAALCDGATVGTLKGAKGTNLNCAGGVVAKVNGAAVDPNALAFTNLLFDTKFEDLGLTVNDLRLTKEFDSVSVTGGYYYSHQNINTAWESWNARLQVLSTGENIDYVATNAGIDANGNPVDVLLTNNGAVTQSFLAWDWNLQYTTAAPYINVAFKISDDFSFDASVRYDQVKARGVRLDACCGGNVSTDLNGNGSIGQFAVSGAGVITRLDSDALLENSGTKSSGFISGGVRVLNEQNAKVTSVNYDANNTSFSLGGTYLLNEDSSVFARYSDGGRAVADRLTQVAGSLNSDGSLSDTTDGYDNVQQLEVGYKLLAGNWNFFATAFNTITEETNAELTSGVTFVREYKANGLELEGKYTFNDYIGLRGNTTWSDAKIAKDKFNPAVVGNKPRRQADLIWTLSPELTFDAFTVGIAVQGTTDFYLQDNNDLKQNAYNLINLYSVWNIDDQLTASANINNLTDEFVITESEEGSAANGSIIRARPVSGRSMSVSLGYSF
jgi:outer membrane receptor protein involved in Fe transport